MNILLHKKDPKTIWSKASEFLIKSLKDHENEKIFLLLSGGSAVKLYERIAKYELRSTNLAFAQVDERFQPESKEDINAYQIEKTGLWKVCGEKNIPYYLVPQEGTLEQAAGKYNSTLKDLFEHFPYKIGVLGIGEDCHIAGLIPRYKASWNKDKLVAGYEIDHGQSSAKAELCHRNFRKRISVTPRVLEKLDRAIVVALGEKKKWAIENALSEANIDNLNKYPAAILQKIKKVDLFTDVKIPYV